MSIRARIRERLERGGSPADVSRDVIADLQDGEIRDALAVALPYLVRDENRKQRHGAIGRKPASSEHRQVHQSEERAWEDKARSLRVAGTRAHDASAAARERRAAILETQVSVDGEWKALGDCSANDLRVLAAGLRRTAATHTDRAERFEKLADRLDRAGAATVEGITANGVREAFGDA